MAWRMRVKLPALKVTKRTKEGVVRCSLPRGRGLTESTADAGAASLPAHLDCDERAAIVDAGDVGVDMAKTQPANASEVSLHYVKQKAATAAWNQVRPALLRAAIEESAMPAGQCCINCPEGATHRCTQCAPWAYYCQQCYDEAHSKTNFFHVGEVWEVGLLLFVRDCKLYHICLSPVCQDGMYKSVRRAEKVIDVRRRHDCSSASSIHLCCLDENGTTCIKIINIKDIIVII